VETLFNTIAQRHNLSLLDFKPLQGGDINSVYYWKCLSGNFVIKLNSATRFPEMFNKEAQGLQLLASSGSFKVPKVITFNTIEEYSYIILQYIIPGTKGSLFWEQFGQSLAQLHQITQDTFGLTHDNYIGSLPQYNNSEKLASEFYINQRLQPQFEMAGQRGYIFKELDVFLTTITSEIPNESPSLIHGDLWNGNYLVSEEGSPVLIDPAVCYGPREMDIAIMHLFGGFPSKVFSIYNEVFPLTKNWETRTSLWQLYYLLVHLNLFGAGYLPQVKQIVKQYT